MYLCSAAIGSASRKLTSFDIFPLRRLLVDREDFVMSTMHESLN